MRGSRRRTCNGPAYRPRVERRHGVLQAGWHLGYRRHPGTHGHRARDGQTGHRRTGRAAVYRGHRCNRQRRRKRVGRPRAARPVDTKERIDRIASSREERLMQNFEYANPSTLKEATSLLGSSWADAQVLAGGTDLISLMKDYLESPRRVVNIKNIKELNGVSSSKGHVRIGALVTFEDLMNNATVRKEFPSLV